MTARRLMLAERKQRIAFELCSIAQGAPWWLQHAAGLVLDMSSRQQLGLTSQPPPNPERPAMTTTTETIARAQRDWDETEESTDTCPLHGAECAVWATLGADE